MDQSILKMVWTHEAYERRKLNLNIHHKEGNVAVRKAGRVRACHQILMCEPGVTNTKVGQEHLSVSDPLGGGALSFNRGLNLGQFIANTLSSFPAGLPRLTDCSGDGRLEKRIEVLKGQRYVIGGWIKTGLFGHAICLFIARSTTWNGNQQK